MDLNMLTGLALNDDFIFRLIINLVSISILVWGCYYRHQGQRANASSYTLFGLGVFCVTGLLHASDISMGFAFGLFAVFSMLRYRTESITIKEMTYLFLVISIALISAVGPATLQTLVAVNLLICAVAFLLEARFVTGQLHYREIQYEKIENLKPQNAQELLDDLVDRTGLDIASIEIKSMDFLKDTAQLTIFFRPEPAKIMEVNYEQQ